MTQIAANAASIAAGRMLYDGMSSAVGGMFGGGSSKADDVPAQQDQPMQQSTQQSSSGCADQTRLFLDCMRDHYDDATGACADYLQALRSCQSAARQPSPL